MSRGRFGVRGSEFGVRGSRFGVLVAAIVAGLVLARAATAGAQTREQQKVLAQIKAADSDQLAVSEEDGRFLRVLIAASGARHVLEIGGAYGYSAIWIGLGMRQTGGHLTSIEFDTARAKLAAEHIRRAGLADIVTIVPGDAFKELPKVPGAIDFVFLDAWKRDYKSFLDLLLPSDVPPEYVQRLYAMQATAVQTIRSAFADRTAAATDPDGKH